MIAFISGASIAFALSLVLALMLGFGFRDNSHGHSFSWRIVLRCVAEVALFMVAVAALIVTVIIGTGVSWAVFAGYALVRIAAVSLELRISGKML